MILLRQRDQSECRDEHGLREKASRGSRRVEWNQRTICATEDHLKDGRPGVDQQEANVGMVTPEEKILCCVNEEL